MASPLAPAAPQPEAPEKPAMNKFRLGEEHNSDASDSDQSDASGRALSPSRKGLTKSGKRKERKQFGAFADELGDLLGSAFQQPAKDSAASSGNADRADGDLEMQVEPSSSGPKMSKRKRQNLEKMEARKRLREQSKMIASGAPPAPVERRGMTLQDSRGKRPDAKKNTTQARRERKEKARIKKAVEQGDRMDIE